MYLSICQDSTWRACAVSSSTGSIHLSIYLSIYLPGFKMTSLRRQFKYGFYPSIYLSIYLPGFNMASLRRQIKYGFYPSIYLSIYLPGFNIASHRRQFKYGFYPSIYLSIYLSTRIQHGELAPSVQVRVLRLRPRGGGHARNIHGEGARSVYNKIDRY